MTTIEKIRKEFVGHLRSARAAREEMQRKDDTLAYRYEIEAEAWQLALATLNKHAAEEAKEQPAESAGPMPWRLQIAAMIAMTPHAKDFTEALVLADKLIAEHERTK